MIIAYYMSFFIVILIRVLMILAVCVIVFKISEFLFSIIAFGVNCKISLVNIVFEVKFEFYMANFEFKVYLIEFSFTTIAS